MYIPAKGDQVRNKVTGAVMTCTSAKPFASCFGELRVKVAIETSIGRIEVPADVVGLEPYPNPIKPVYVQLALW